jgi:cytochrome P450
MQSQGTILRIRHPRCAHDAPAERQRSPRDDLITKAVQHRIKGEPLSDDEVLGFCYLMFVGGLDTVAASLGFHYKHLAEHPELQERLRREPASRGARVLRVDIRGAGLVPLENALDLAVDLTDAPATLAQLGGFAPKKSLTH